jgi:branched-chain amino acid transport system permease protein
VTEEGRAPSSVPNTVATDARRQQVSRLRGFNSAAVVPWLGSFFVAALLFWLTVNLIKEPDDFIAVALEGLTLGLVYGLVALGYSLVYGILELINFAHGDVFMLGSWVTLSVAVHELGLDESSSGIAVVGGLLVTLLAAMAFCGLLNASIERVAYRPLRNAPRLAPLITAIGMSFILQDVGLNRLGPAPVSLPNILPTDVLFEIGGNKYRWSSFIVALSTIPVLILLVWLVQRTRQGKAMRATAQDQEAAAMMGINVNRTISFTFLIAGSLAGVAGLLYALYSTNIQYDQGFTLGLIAFTAAVLGGIGNLPGAVLGAIIIGMIQQFNEGLTWHAPGSDWTQSIVFAILILILVFRPEGLLGERTPEGG